VGNVQARVDAALLLPPYYFSAVAEDGLERWLRNVLESAHQPVYLYNFPAHTGNMIGPGLYARLAHDFPLLRGIKNTFDDVPMAQQFKYALPDRQVMVLSSQRKNFSSITCITCLSVFSNSASFTYTLALKGTR
jgi:dihydrodipicolinate synthase/N-acetylneuraminate lyase